MAFLVPGLGSNTSSSNPFVEFLDEAAGLIPVVGTVKDGVEAIVYASQGKKEAAEEKLLETEVDLLCDIATFLTMGEGAGPAEEVKVVAKTAIKETFEEEAKQAAKGVTKDIAEQRVKYYTEKAATEAAMKQTVAKGAEETATKDIVEQEAKFGTKDAEKALAKKIATPHIAAMRNVQKLTIFAVVEAAKWGIKSRIRSESTSRLTCEEGDVATTAGAHQRTKAAGTEQQQASYSANTVTVIEGAKAFINERMRKYYNQKPAKPEAKTKESEKKSAKRGEHVINNGVRKVLPNIIDSFLEVNVNQFQYDTTFKLLVDSKCITPEMDVYKSHERPLPPTIEELIDPKMKVFVTSKDEYVDENAAVYGMAMYELTSVVVQYMSALFNRLVLEKNIPPSPLMTQAITEIVTRINTLGSEVYVDQQAKTLWLAKPGNFESDYQEARDYVARMFNSVMPQQEKVIVWATDLFNAHKKFHDRSD